MKKWGIIILILVVCLACGITAASFWDYLIEIVQIATAYIFDLCRSIIDALTSKVGEIVPPVTTTQPETACIFIPNLYVR